MSWRSDQEWVSELQASGEVQRQAFSDLGRYLFKVVWNYLRKRQGTVPRLRQLGHAEWEELARGFTQEALQTVWEKLCTYEGRGKLTSWVATIAIRTAAYELGSRTGGRTGCPNRRHMTRITTRRSGAVLIGNGRRRKTYRRKFEHKLRRC